jgi:predicted DNA-binding protein
MSRQVKIGHLTLRIDTETHERLIQMSHDLGVPVAALIKICIKKCLPLLRDLAEAELKE